MGNKHFEKGGEPDELKTLNDLPTTDDVIDGENAVYREDVKALAIKWIKEEMNIVGGLSGELPESIDRWMKRLSITQENLK